MCQFSYKGNINNNNNNTVFYTGHTRYGYTNIMHEFVKYCLIQYYKISSVDGFKNNQETRALMSCR